LMQTSVPAATRLNGQTPGSAQSPSSITQGFGSVFNAAQVTSGPQAAQETLRRPMRIPGAHQIVICQNRRVARSLFKDAVVRSLDRQPPFQSAASVQAVDESSCGIQSEKGQDVRRVLNPAESADSRGLTSAC
jgi:hypothetical protein